MSSYFPCPKGCVSSAGSEDFITAKKVSTDARKSLSECMASEMILIEPEITPATNFKMIITALEVIERPAANFFSVIIFIFVSNILAYFWCFYQPLTTRRFFGYFC